MSASSTTVSTHHHSAFADLAFGNGLGFLLWEQRRLRRADQYRRSVGSHSPFVLLRQRHQPALGRADQWRLTGTPE
jgi:hypothetical protein